MSQPIQNLQNHARIDPIFHFFLAPVTFALMCWAWVHHFHVKTLDSFFIAAALVILLLAIFLIRTYSLKIQNRLIRLEESLRLQRLAGDSLRSRLPELTLGQLIALRFASDAEVVALANRTLDEKLTPKQIKTSIQNWRADHYRV